MSLTVKNNWFSYILTEAEKIDWLQILDRFSCDKDPNLNLIKDKRIFSDNS